MPCLDKLKETPRRELLVFYVLDTSASMYGTAISELNRAVEESIEALKECAKNNGDVRLKIAVLEFNSNCKWINPNEPEYLEDFEWQDLEVSPESSEIGVALRELNSKLSRNAFLKSMTGRLMPVIIFMTDGNFTDDYKEELEKIRKNKWFQRSTKIAFAIGENPDEEMIAEIVGNNEVVITSNNMQLFKKLIRFVEEEIEICFTMPPSSLLGYSRTVTDRDILQDAKKELDLPDDVTSSLSDSEYNKEPEAINIDSIDDDWDEEG